MTEVIIFGYLAESQRKSAGTPIRENELKQGPSGRKNEKSITAENIKKFFIELNVFY